MKVLLIGSYILLNIITTVLIFGAQRADDKLLIIFGSLLVSVFFQMILTFLMWNAIRGGKSSINPYVATALHLVPLFNILWTIILFGIYPGAYNKFVDEKEKENKEFTATYISSTPFTFYIILSCSMVIAAFIPFINMIVGLAAFITYIMVISTACDGIKSLNEFQLFSTKTISEKPNTQFS